MLAVIAVAFVFGFIGSMPLAGPVALLVFSRAVDGHIGEAFRIALGAALAEGIYAAVAFFGFSTFLSRHSVVLPVSHGITAVVLLVVGVYFLFWTDTSGAEPAKSDQRGTLFLGFTVSALNPTLLVTWSAAVAWLYSKELAPSSASWMAAPFGASAAAGVGVWFVVLVVLIRRYRGRFRQRILQWVVRAMGLALIGLSVWSAVQLAGWLRSR